MPRPQRVTGQIENLCTALQVLDHILLLGETGHRQPVGTMKGTTAWVQMVSMPE